MKRQLSAAALLALAMSASGSAPVTPPTWSLFPFSNEVTDLKIFRRTPQSQPVIWIGSRHGVTRIRGGDTLRYHMGNSPLPGNEIISQDARTSLDRITTATALDSAGNYWIAFNAANRLAKISPDGGMEIIAPDAGAPWSDIQDLSASRSRICIATRSGIVYSGSTDGAPTWIAVTGPAAAGSQLLSAQIDEPSQTLWLGYYGSATTNLKSLRLDSLSAGIRDFHAGGTAPVKEHISRIWTTGGSIPIIRTFTLGMYSSFLIENTYAVHPQRIFTLGLNARCGYAGFNPNIGHYIFRRDSIFSVSLPARDSVTAPVLISRGLHLSGLSCAAVLLSEGSATQFLLGRDLPAAAKHLSAPPGLFLGRAPTSPLDMPTLDLIIYQPRLSGNGMAGSAVTDSGLWFATDSALHFLQDTVCTVRHRPVGNIITSLSKDSSGNLWIGRSDGLHLYRNDLMLRKGPMDSTDTVIAMTHTREFGWYYTRRRGLAQLHLDSAGTWSTIPLTSLGGDSVRIVKLRAFGSGRTLFALTETGSLFALNNGLFWFRWAGAGTSFPTVQDFDITGSRIWTGTQQQSGYFWNAGNLLGSASSASMAQSSFSGLVRALSDSTAIFADDSVLHFVQLAENILRRDSTVALPGSLTGSGYANAIENDRHGDLWIIGPSMIAHRIFAPSPVEDTDTVSVAGHIPSFPSRCVLNRGHLLLRLSGDADVSFRIFDLSGRLREHRRFGILSAGQHQLPLPATTGLYLILLQAGNERLIFKAGPV